MTKDVNVTHTVWVTSALTKVFDLPKITGDKDGKWDFQIEFYSYDTGNLVAKVDKVDFTYMPDKGRMNVKAYSPREARDCDGWQLRLFDLRLEGVTLNFMEGRFFTGTGFMESLGYFGEGEDPGIEDGYVDSCFPPEKFDGKDRSSFLRVSFTFSLRKGVKS